MKIVLLSSLLTLPLLANELKVDSYSTSLDFAQVTFVEAKQSSDNTWCFNTTVHHQDEGWDHYANAWIIHDKDGNQLAKRVLLHPHDTEQPFTRSLCQVNIPDFTTEVVVSAACNVHGNGGHVVEIDLTQKEGVDFSVKHYK
jgi:hypothetical protein